MQREKLGSRLGFILLSAGCAIGIGNVWKFPYMVGQYGGGAFVLIYLFFLAILGVPVLTMEFAIGRAAQKSPVKFYQELEPKGSKWHWHGYVALAENYLLLMFYTSVAGWLLQYFGKTARRYLRCCSQTHRRGGNRPQDPAWGKPSGLCGTLRRFCSLKLSRFLRELGGQGGCVLHPQGRCV
jgi:SNF family Na+-dependent transporter